VHDLLISKYCAGREKDLEFCAAVVNAGLADRETLEARLVGTRCDDAIRARVAARIEADYRARPSRAEKR
jgi:hypothetical protein